MTVFAIKSKVKINEIPITFIEREAGKSKINFRIILEAVMYLLSYKSKN